VNLKLRAYLCPIIQKHLIMPVLKILTKNGLQVINEGFNSYMCSPSAPIFKAVEGVFDQWMKDSNPASEYYEMYFGEEAIYTKRGAIVGGIEAVIEYMIENNLTYITTKNFNEIDIEGTFC
jgi:hypothetical protein